MLYFGTIQAQIKTTLDLRLWTRLNTEHPSDKNISLLVKGDIDAVKWLTEQFKGNYKYGYRNISSVEIPEKHLLAFSKSDAIEKIEGTGAKGVSLMDTARIRNNIDSVHAGFPPLLTDLKGRNVVVGIIDGGIYWQHEDFKKANGDTRIRYIWDQVSGGANHPLGYTYGHECNWLDINNGNCTHVPPASDFGHGTSVAGIASGNSLSTVGTALENQFTGVAPESEIIAVRISYSGNFLANMADAVDYIFKKADALGKPCVINTSIGTYYGSHDGIDLASQMIEALLEERNGRALVAAAGNGGHIPHHLGYNLSVDSAYTFFKYNSTYKEVYFDFWADTSDFKSALFAVGCNDGFGNHLRRTAYFNVPADFNPPPGNYIVNTTYLPNNAKFDTVSIAASLDEGRYHVEVFIHPSDVTNYWRLQTTGSGKFDLWSSAALIGSADMTSTLSSGTPIQYPNYRHPDSLKTMVSSWQNSDKVITVGNYSNRSSYLDVDSNEFNLTNNLHTECFGVQLLYNEVVGTRFKTSSFGPTRDGRLKPDVMATGSTVLATADAINADLLLYANGGCNRFKVGFSGKHMRNGGTSMASPIVAGIAALYFEKRPTATYDEIKAALICTATSDSFTGNTPNYEYGNGKVNAFAALTAPASCFTYGAKDTTCINYNPIANTDTGGCIAKVYGCTDSLATNFNPAANINNGSCLISSINNVVGNKISVQVIPNPFSEQTTFRITGGNYKTGVIRIFDQVGALVDEIPIIEGKTEFVYRNASLSKGFYSYVLTTDDNYLGTGKLVAE
jgi:subtilisin family serine protease